MKRFTYFDYTYNVAMSDPQTASEYYDLGRFEDILLCMVLHPAPLWNKLVFQVRSINWGTVSAGSGVTSVY